MSGGLFGGTRDPTIVMQVRASYVLQEKYAQVSGSAPQRCCLHVDLVCCLLIFAAQFAVAVAVFCRTLFAVWLAVRVLSTGCQALAISAQCVSYRVCVPGSRFLQGDHLPAPGERRDRARRLLLLAMPRRQRYARALFHVVSTSFTRHVFTSFPRFRVCVVAFARNRRAASRVSRGVCQLVPVPDAALFH